MSTTNAGKLIEGQATDMNAILQGRRPPAEAEAAPEADAAPPRPCRRSTAAPVPALQPPLT